MVEGWQKSLIRDPMAIIDRFLGIQYLSELDRNELGFKVIELATAKYHLGMVTDIDMYEAGLHNYFDQSTIVNTTGLCLNRQRSCILTGESAHELRNGLINAMQTRKLAATCRQQAVRVQAATKEVVESREFEVISGPPPANVVFCSRGSYMKVGKDKLGWSGCPVKDCLYWACSSSVTCKKDLNNHIIKHVASLVSV